jgi:hypothetical protein
MLSMLRYEYIHMSSRLHTYVCTYIDVLCIPRQAFKEPDPPENLSDAAKASEFTDGDKSEFKDWNKAGTQLMSALSTHAYIYICTYVHIYRYIHTITDWLANHSVHLS